MLGEFGDATDRYADAKARKNYAGLGLERPLVAALQFRCDAGVDPTAAAAISGARLRA